MYDAIKIDHLSKVYKGKNGDIHSLKDVSLTVARGDFVALLGHNGAGKSTMIDIIASMVSKTSGKVFINGIDIDLNHREAKYCIGVVPQEISLDPFLCVYDILELYSLFYGISNNTKHINNLLDNLDLADKKYMPPKMLSGGMKRRLMIAKALIHNPSIIILDEPTAGVDVGLRAKMWEYMRFLHNEGKTIILTTHYLEEAEQMAKKVAILNRGSLVAFEDKDTLLRNFADETMSITFSGLLSSDSCKKIIAINAKILCTDTSIILPNNPIFASQIMSMLHDDSLTIVNIAIQKPRLEDVMTHLTLQS
jgi:ABC-2 type transport system ATP-binding protein